jgi:hypothetical protein
MAIQIGRADAVVASTDAVTTTIDVNVGFTPTAGQYFVLVYCSGATSATDAVGSATIHGGIGFAVSATSRGGNAFHSLDGQGTSASDKSLFNDAVLKMVESAAESVVGALDFAGEITNGVQFVVDDQFPVDLRFQVVVIDGLTDAGIFQITAPGSTGNADHTGAGVDDADLFLFLQSGPNTSLGTSTAIQSGFGAAHADGQCTVNMVTRDAQVTMDTYHYGNDQECIAIQNVAGSVIARASFVGAITDGLTLNWLEAGAPNTIVLCAALKGIEATIQSGLTQTDTTTDIVVTGLGDTCLGGLVVSNCEAESAQDTGGTHHHFSIGSFTATNNRGAHATWDEDGTANSECATAVEYDAVYANIASDDTIQGLMDIKSLDADGATFIMDDADPAQKWFAAILFAEVVAGGPGVDEMMAAAQMGAMPVMVAQRLRALGYSVEPPSIAHSQVNDIAWLPVYPSTIKITYEATPSGEQV